MYIYNIKIPVHEVIDDETKLFVDSQLIVTNISPCTTARLAAKYKFPLHTGTHTEAQVFS